MLNAQMEALSPFELSLYLEKQARRNPKQQLLNAGRGNPNWTAPTPREAYFLLGLFATDQTRRDDVSLTADQVTASESVVASLKAFLKAHPGKGADFLSQMLTLDEATLGMPLGDWLTQILDGIIGDNYPAPVRGLKAAKQPVKRYLNELLFADSAPDYDIFQTEGGSAGICYLFDTLYHNGLLEQGDRIALLLPTFAPYLEIPHLPHYQFDVVNVSAEQIDKNGKPSYQYPQSELDKLRDPAVKAAFIVNPSNPTANAMSGANRAYIKQIIDESNPQLMLLTDDVYGTFIPNFHSLFASLPYNTACIYSYSKYFGATGWRLGIVAIAKENVFDDRLKELDPAQLKVNAERYRSVTPDVDKLAFIDRMVADSRDVALNHASGLSTPQQVMATLFSLYALLDDGEAYQEEVMQICHDREHRLFSTLGLSTPIKARDTAYYADLDLMELVRNRYSEAFATYMETDWTVTQLLAQLAKKEQVMLIKTDAFGSKPWAVRVSLANLATSEYEEVGRRLLALLDWVHEQWQAKQPGGHANANS